MEKLNRAPKILNFGASKPRVKGGLGPRDPPVSASVFAESHCVIWFSVISYLGLQTN